ncbi:MAG: NTP transferase domain-containing protein [Acidobacteria bacterium]|nr:NTP transferase domain-containing protein [Acidobacteriota bacterium]
MIETAVILAAGKGTRMGRLTAETPKPMLPLAGKPMLEHILDRMRGAGIRRVLIVIGYRGDLIREHFADYPLAMEYREQEVANGTGSAALLAREFVGGDAFVLTFGDILCSTEDYQGLMAKLDEAAAGVLGVKYVDDPAPGAAVYEENDRVVRIVEKPPVGTSTTHWNSAGLYAFRPEVFAELARIPLSPRGEYELTTAVEQLIERDAVVRMYPIEQEWMDVGRPEDLARGETLVRS